MHVRVLSTSTSLSAKMREMVEDQDADVHKLFPRYCILSFRKLFFHSDTEGGSER